ncbi:MAG: SGNH/GDSL hydrolase family protein, partial [Methylococcales bacterium]
VTDYSVGGTTSENARLGTGFFVPPYVSFANQMSTRDTADYVLIRYGINDSSNTVGISQAQFRSNLNEFITQARAALKTPILVNIISMPVTWSVPQWRIDLVDAYNVILEDVATLASVTLIDLRSAVTNYTADRVSGDGIHPSAEASLEINEKLTQLLAKQLAPTYTLHKTIVMPITYTGPTGDAGAANYLVERGASLTSTAPTPDEIYDAVGRYARLGDVVTVSYNSRTAANQFKCSFSEPLPYILPPGAAGAAVWAPLTTYMPGSLIVENTITASKLMSSNTGTNLTGMQFALGQTALVTTPGAIGNYDTAGAFSTSSLTKFGVIVSNTGAGTALVAVSSDTTGNTGSGIIGVGAWNATTGAFKTLGQLGNASAAGIFRGKSSVTLDITYPTAYSTLVNLGTP